MNEVIMCKIEEIKELLKSELPTTTTSVKIWFNYCESRIEISDRTATELEAECISMKNIQGDFIR